MRTVRKVIVSRSTPLSSVDGPTVEEVAVSAVDLDDVESGFLASATTLDDFLQQTTLHVPLDSIKVGLLELVDVLRGHRDGVRILARLERDFRRANDCACPSAQHRSWPASMGSPLLGHPPTCSEDTEPPSHPSSWAILSTHGASVEAFRPAWASWIPILPRWAWTKSTMRLKPTMCESFQIPWTCQQERAGRWAWKERDKEKITERNMGRMMSTSPAHAVLRGDSTLGGHGCCFHHDQTPAPHGHASEMYEVMIRGMPIVGRVCQIPHERPRVITS